MGRGKLYDTPIIKSYCIKLNRNGDGKIILYGKDQLIGGDLQAYLGKGLHTRLHIGVADILMSEFPEA